MRTELNYSVQAACPRLEGQLGWAESQEATQPFQDSYLSLVEEEESTGWLGT